MPETQSDCNKNKNEMKNVELRDALSAIAKEIILLQNSTTNIDANVNDIEDVFNKLLKSKSALTNKRKLIRKLKEKVKTACTVAQAAISAGENESTSLNGHLHLARNEYADLYQKHRQTSQIIQSMTKENKVIRDELENITHVIALGYNELQKTNECLFESSAAQQLKQIIVCCGQYYADFNNEKDRNIQLQQKNRFLNNKISILNNSLDGMSEDLRNLRRQNERLQKENNFLRERKEKDKQKYIVPISLQGNKNHQTYVHTIRMTNVRSAPELDVTVHLSIVKKLLRDQDELLRDLKRLSERITVE